ARPAVRKLCGFVPTDMQSQIAWRARAEEGFLPIGAIGLGEISRW
ncbi:MAG: hypothetical protein JWR00_3887, partial [Rubritepida sp.]|nr:hypothetical protein [Rubritepida sp.]